MNKKILPYLDSPKALRALNQKLLPKLANEVRETIVDFVAVKKGHLAASLGVVELTIALHYVFETPNDLLVWDVGHQAYGHKLLTGRFNNFESMAPEYLTYTCNTMCTQNDEVHIKDLRYLFDFC